MLIVCYLIEKLIEVCLEVHIGENRQFFIYKLNKSSLHFVSLPFSVEKVHHFGSFFGIHGGVRSLKEIQFGSKKQFNQATHAVQFSFVVKFSSCALERLRFVYIKIVEITYSDNFSTQFIILQFTDHAGVHHHVALACRPPPHCPGLPPTSSRRSLPPSWPPAVPCFDRATTLYSNCRISVEEHLVPSTRPPPGTLPSVSSPHHVNCATTATNVNCHSNVNCNADASYVNCSMHSLFRQITAFGTGSTLFILSSSFVRADKRSSDCLHGKFTLYIFREI